MLQSEVNKDINYKYTGQEHDDETGLDNYKARWYDSDAPRFLMIDPMWAKYQSFTPYNYCANNPISFVDPDGRDGVAITKSAFDMVYAAYQSDLATYDHTDIVPYKWGGWALALTTAVVAHEVAKAMQSRQTRIKSKESANKPQSGEARKAKSKGAKNKKTAGKDIKPAENNSAPDVVGQSENVGGNEISPHLSPLGRVAVGAAATAAAASKANQGSEGNANQTNNSNNNTPSVNRRDENRNR